MANRWELRPSGRPAACVVVHLRNRIPTLGAGSAAIFLAAHGRISHALSVVAVGLVAELAAAAALAIQGAGEGLRESLRHRLGPPDDDG
jgi:hypothetical protein